MNDSYPQASSVSASLKAAAAFGVIIFIASLSLTWCGFAPLEIQAPPGTLLQHLGYWLSGFAALLTHGDFGAERWAVYVKTVGLLSPALKYGIYARLLLLMPA